MTRQDSHTGTKTDCITVRGIRTSGVHGVLDFEHHLSQDFVVDVKIWFDSRPAAQTDDLAQSVDYSKIAEKVQSVVLGKRVSLIERLAQRIAMEVLENKRVDAVEVTVHKPQAPMSIEFQDVCIQIYRTRQDYPGETQDYPGETSAFSALLRSRPDKPRTVILALGANLGNPVRTLREVVQSLRSAPEFSEVKVSPLAQTRPVLEANQAPQPDYYNAVVRLVTRLSAVELLDLARHLEAQHHRERLSHWAARTLDIDLIDVEGVASSNPRLTLPHPRAAGRAFVLVPWTLLDAQARLDGKPVADLAAMAADRGGIVRLWPDWLEWDDSEIETRLSTFSPEKPGKLAIPEKPETTGELEKTGKAGKPGSRTGVESRLAHQTLGQYGLPSWRAAFDQSGEARVVDDVTGDIVLDTPGKSGKKSAGHGAEPPFPGTEASHPERRGRKHGAC